MSEIKKQLPDSDIEEGHWSEPSTGTEKQGFRSLTNSLVFWFLLLSLLPLSVVSLLSYQNAHDSLIRKASEQLELSASKNLRFIKNWFDYRFMDLNSQAEDPHSTLLLASLVEGFSKSKQSLPDYIKSFDWAVRVSNNHKQDFITLSRRYDYIYDIFLIDTQGNILFSIAHEADLGTNLVDGPYAGTKFASTVRQTLATGLSLFSDLERYEPSHNLFAGFLTAPVLDKWGSKLGVYAVQLKLDRLFNAMQPLDKSRSMNHYLIGSDGILRSTLDHDNPSMTDVLNRSIDTEQFRLWKEEYGGEAHEHDGRHKHDDSDHHDNAFKYVGPNNNLVLGIHNLVTLPGIKWALVSEIDEKEALSDAIWLRNTTVILLMVTSIVVMVLAIYLARRITRPIIQLADTARLVSAGDIDTQVDISGNNEISRLGEAFNHMLLMRQIHEQALQETTEQAQHALYELEEQKFALDQHSIVAITDLGGTITYANQRFADISGYTIDELLGQNHRMLNSGYHDQQFWKNMYQTVSRGWVWKQEVCNRAKDGHLYWVDTTIVPFKNKDGKPQSYVAIRTDITERKRTESELIQAKEDAEAAVVAKSEFLASMSHEIRTPMNGVLGMLGLVMNTSLSEEQQHRIALAQSSANALLTLINDILDFSKVEAGKLELEILDFNLRTLLGEFVESMALQAQDKGLEVILDVTGVEHSMVRTDPGRLRQILTNLVGNAIKFTEQGEIIITVKLDEEEPETQQSRLYVKVQDTGIGIPEDKLNHLFDSFTQVDASTTRKYGGTGLGLAIAKKLSELMDGSISVSSQEGKGSCFEFNILTYHSDQATLVVPEVDMSKLNLLVVDDNTTNREVLSGQLSHWGASVTEASSGAEALAICAERVDQKDAPFFDIAFLDMQMPKMDGAQLGKSLKADKRFATMKLVMMTSMSHRGDAKYFSELGFSAYFPKPATTNDIFDALSVVADGGEALEQAAPLVTHHYLQTLAHNEHKEAEELELVHWPENTRVLLVEDNRVNQLVAKGVLKSMGLHADIAANGIEALSSLRQAPDDAPYTLVLMDCQMPEMDGYEASTQIRAGKGGMRHEQIPIIAMTANAMQGDREKCLDAGMSDYLSKPIDSDRLYALLRQWLCGEKNQPVQEPVEESDETPVPENSSDELPDWDQSALFKRVKGKTKRIVALIELFLEDMPSRMDELQRAYDALDIEMVRKTAHTIKGVAANISGMKLQTAAAELEAMAKQDQLDSNGNSIKNISIAYELLKQRLQQYEPE